MTEAFANFWNLFDTSATTTPPHKRRPGPVLIGDILTARGQQPELLIRWRADQDAADRD